MPTERASWRRFVGLRLADLVMLVLLAAGLLKAVDITEFALSLLTWEFIPDNAVVPIATVLPAVESSIAAAWFVGYRRRLSLTVGVALIGAATLAYAIHIALARPPDCGCLGLLQLFESSRSSVLVVLIRNGILLTSGLAALILLGSASAARPHPEETTVVV